MDYLANRYQYIETVNDRIDKLQINTGVPQGSILGPFLFLVGAFSLKEKSPTLTVSSFFFS